MVKVNFTIKRVVIMMDNGKTIKCTDSEGYFMQMELQLMKVNGIWINSMVQERFTMIIARKAKKCLITGILIILMINGNTMKEVLFLIQNKGMEKQYWEIMNITKETLVEID